MMSRNDLLCFLCGATVFLSGVLPDRGNDLAEAPNTSKLKDGPVSESAPNGAAVPFTTYEAEAADNSTTGTVVTMTGAPVARSMTPELEASGRGYVSLQAEGQYLQITNVVEANALVIRHCIPDAPTGGGITATLSLYINGEKRQTLTISSFHNWLYGKPGQNGQANDPSAGQPHTFWDEARFFIKGGVKKGDTIKLQRDKDDTAGFYRIDLIDLELAPPPLSPPPADTCLSVTDYGAIGDGKTDDTKAITLCLAAAREQKKIVWIPAGTYCHSERFNLNGVVVQGAGMWHTILVGTEIGTTWIGRMGFNLAGNGAQLRDLSIDSPVYATRGDKGCKPITGNGTNWRVENVWVTHTNVGFWMSGASHGVVRGCRVCCTYADGINLNRGASDNLVENCYVRGCGDDGTAILADAVDATISSNNCLRHNTVKAIWWGANCDLAGGSGHVIEDNCWADNSSGECFTINLPAAYPMHPLTGATIRHNRIIRGGGNINGQQRGAVWIYAGSVPISNALFEDNQILNSFFHAIHLAGGYHQEMTFRQNVIKDPGGDAIYVESTVKGSGNYIHNTITGLKEGDVSFKNASSDYTVIMGTAP